MRRPRHPSDRDELGALLRLGDPAQGDPGPDGADLARMRRAMLAEAGRDHGRIAAAGSRLVVAAALVAAAVITVLIRVEPPFGVLPVEPDSPGLGASTPAHAAVEPASRPQAATALRHAEPGPVVAVLSDTPPAPPADVADPGTPRATTVRFTTPRGTQIIWTLDPRVEL